MDAAFFLRFHTLPRRPLMKAELPILGKVMLDIPAPRERESLTSLELVCRVLGLDRQTASAFLSMWDVDVIVRAIKEEIEKVDPSNVLQSFDEVKANINAGLSELWFESLKISMCEHPSDYFGKPVNQLTDMQWLIWRLAYKQRESDG